MGPGATAGRAVRRSEGRGGYVADARRGTLVSKASRGMCMDMNRHLHGHDQTSRTHAGSHPG